MGNVALRSGPAGENGKLSQFQISKLTFDFNTFFDLNSDGYLSYKDFQWAKDRICALSGWKIDSEKYKRTEKLFTEIWASLLDVGDTDNDGRITISEWLALWEKYKMELIKKEKEVDHFLEKFYSTKNPDFRKLKTMGAHLGENVTDTNQGAASSVSSAEPQNMDTILPNWLHDYLLFRFELLDRTGDGQIDHEEYEYVLSEFGLKEKDALQAFKIFTQHTLDPVDFTSFVQLFEEYYLSDNPADLGNFINGKLDFSLVLKEPEIEEKSIDEIIQEYTSAKEDDMMQDSPKVSKKEEKPEQKDKKIKILKRVKKMCKLDCMSAMT